MPPAALLPTFAPWFDLAGLAVFAASGALAAARRGQTMVTLAFFALITGVGGGTMRDLLIGAPVFWVQDSRAAGVCLSVAFVIWVTPERWWRGEALDWFDAVGLAAYAVYGTAKALRFGALCGADLARGADGRGGNAGRAGGFRVACGGNPLAARAPRLSPPALSLSQSRTTPISAKRLGSTGGTTLSFNSHCQKPTSIHRPCL